MVWQEIARRGVAAPGLPDGAVGWIRETALQLLQSLPGKLAIFSIDVFDRVPGGFAASGDAWTSFRMANESAADFAVRTRREARAWVAAFPRDEVLFVIDFDDQAEAAEAFGSA